MVVFYAPPMHFITPTLTPDCLQNVYSIKVERWHRAAHKSKNHYLQCVWGVARSERKASSIYLAVNREEKTG